MIKERKIFAYCQKKAWSNELIIKLEISKVWRKYYHFINSQGYYATPWQVHFAHGNHTFLI